MKHSNILILSEVTNTLKEAISICKENRIVPFLITLIYEAEMKDKNKVKHLTLAYSCEDFNSMKYFIRNNKIKPKMTIVTWKEDLDGEEL